MFCLYVYACADEFWIRSLGVRFWQGTMTPTHLCLHVPFNSSREQSVYRIDLDRCWILYLLCMYLRMTLFAIFS